MLPTLLPCHRKIFDRVRAPNVCAPQYLIKFIVSIARCIALFYIIFIFSSMTFIALMAIQYGNFVLSMHEFDVRYAANQNTAAVAAVECRV